MAALTLDLLRTFTELPTGGRYRADGEQIRLLTLYLLVRQLTPALTFETFLERFAPLADFDEENRKMPEDAVKHHCPRIKRHATERGVPSWSAKDVKELLVLYVDMCRLADEQQIEVPVTLDEFLADTGPDFINGTVARPEKTPKTRATQAPARVASLEVPSVADGDTGINMGAPMRPTTAQQRVLLEHPLHVGRQLRGWVAALTTDAQQRPRVTVLADDGQLFVDQPLSAVQVMQEENAPTPPNVGDATRTTLTIAARDRESVFGYLNMRTPVGNVTVGSAIHSWTAAFEGGVELDIQLINGEGGPYVDAQFVDTVNDNVIVELAPREMLLGYYFADISGTRYCAHVR